MLFYSSVTKVKEYLWPTCSSCKSKRAFAFIASRCVLTLSAIFAWVWGLALIEIYPREKNMQNENYFARKGIPEGERGEENICLVTRFNVQFSPWNPQEKSIYNN